MALVLFQTTAATRHGQVVTRSLHTTLLFPLWDSAVRTIGAARSSSRGIW